MKAASRGARIALPVLATLGLLALGAAGATAAQRPGRAYAGTTARHQEVSLLLSRTRRSITALSIGWAVGAAGCSNGQPVRSTVLFGRGVTGPIRIGRRGHFSKRYKRTYPVPNGQISVEARVVGRVTAAKAVGTLRVLVGVANATGRLVAACDTSGIRWTAIQ